MFCCFFPVDFLCILLKKPLWCNPLNLDILRYQWANIWKHDVRIPVDISTQKIWRSRNPYNFHSISKAGCCKGNMFILNEFHKKTPYEASRFAPNLYWGSCRKKTSRTSCRRKDLISKPWCMRVLNCFSDQLSCCDARFVFWFCVLGNYQLLQGSWKKIMDFLSLPVMFFVTQVFHGSLKKSEKEPGLPRSMIRWAADTRQNHIFLIWLGVVLARSGPDHRQWYRIKGVGVLCWSTRTSTLLICKKGRQTYFSNLVRVEKCMYIYTDLILN